MTQGIAKVFNGKLKAAPPKAQVGTNFYHHAIIRDGASYAAALSTSEQVTARGTKHLLTFSETNEDNIMSEQFDVIIIGGGPGGYVAAIRAAQLGLKRRAWKSAGRWVARA